MIHWRDLLTERDFQVYQHRGYRKLTKPGPRPALLVVDINYYFLGAEPRPILEAIRDWPQSCGLEGWRSLSAVSKLLQCARKRDIPIFFTTGKSRKPEHQPKGEKSASIEGLAFPPEIAPHPSDHILVKEKPSAFFGTTLLSQLIRERIDTLLVTGCTTSGCVRATVVDASSYEMHVIVVEEATFDRIQASHAINLFDMHTKYAQVVNLNEALSYLGAPDTYQLDEQPSVSRTAVKEK